jgi:hypothetical protein
MKQKERFCQWGNLDLHGALGKLTLQLAGAIYSLG